ncbi:Prenylcysteine oxidase [Ophiobolus disseminans]|uniref:Prenylcysteine oxidase n=1 Tax=Ophiobolus disseminans TaxID=1469910 RepID=A0A6A7A3J9_9PLEO|nr:Prenylcysteine oxidase [Ophiobolus disseminans]
MVRMSRVASLLSFTAAVSTLQTPHAKRVAIIGAGAGGSSTAYHLALYANEASIPADITVFERNTYIGGRTTTVNVWNQSEFPVELGGSIFVEVNHIMMDAMKRFGLSPASQDLISQLAMPELGIWNGQEFVLITTQEESWWDKAKLLWKYGPAPLLTNRLMKSVVGKFLTMYDEPVFPWKSLSDVVERLGLLEATGVTGEQYLKANGIGETFAREIIQASTRVNYASNLGYIHGLEAMVCMATNGAMAIKGGNWQIFASMLDASSAELRLNTTVSRVSKQKDSTYILGIADGSNATFDEVILAAPLQYTDLVIDPAPKHTPDEIPYARLYTTLFASPYQLDPLAFNLAPGSAVPQYVLTTLPPTETPEDNVGSPGFYSISIHDQYLNLDSHPPRLEFVYKIFSPMRVTPEFFASVLGHKVSEDEANYGDINGTVSWVHHKIWHSYPREYPRVTFEEIKLDEGLWYTSGIESFISTMETSALSGKNVARLVRDEWMVKRKEEEGKVRLGNLFGGPASQELLEEL